MKVDLGLAVGLAITALPQPFNVPLLGAALTVHAVRSLRRAVKAKREERKESAGGGFGEKVQHPRFGAWVTVADTLHQPDLPREIAGTHAASCLHAGVVAAELQPGGPEERRREEGAAQQLTWSCSAGSVAGADGQQRPGKKPKPERGVPFEARTHPLLAYTPRPGSSLYCPPPAAPITFSLPLRRAEHNHVLGVVHNAPYLLFSVYVACPLAPRSPPYACCPRGDLLVAPQLVQHLREERAERRLQRQRLGGERVRQRQRVRVQEQQSARLLALPQHLLHRVVAALPPTPTPTRS